MTDLPSPMPLGGPNILLTTVLWQAANGVGLERCQLRRLGGFANRAYRLSGAILDVHEGRPIRIRYRVDLDRGWRTTDVLVRASIEPGHDVEVAFRRRGRWKRLDPSTGAWGRVHELDGLIDVDLAFTPATNALPIRRLELPVGGSAAVTAAWLTFPDLTLEPLHQTYARTADRTYRYTSPGFQADLTVDDHGLPVDYPGRWTRTAQHP